MATNSNGDVEDAAVTMSAISKEHPYGRQSFKNRRDSAVQVSPKGSGCCQCFKSWDRERWVITGLGCFSSAVVLAVRLAIDSKGSLAYLLHAIIVFFDMILIHICTHSKWLSASGEIVTYSMVIAYHFTHEVLFELLETTFIAMLVSFNMISERNHAFVEKDGLQGDFNALELRNNQLMRRMALKDIRDLSMSNQECEELKALAKKYYDDDDDDKNVDEANETVSSSTPSSDSYNLLGVPPEDRELSSMERMKKWVQKPCGEDHPGSSECLAMAGSTFFEYFLDGSAGVMVRTSHKSV